ncbi:hypothetical protein ABZ434_02515 [Streptomyces sp. NPDC005761]|uniref:hypothetical protein n=1 Tax=Streptomyces sp. NPDC005761 TaxID=3157066 RepID=UPI0033E26C3B
MPELAPAPGLPRGDIRGIGGPFSWPHSAPAALCGRVDRDRRPVTWAEAGPQGDRP